jgi:hypothetical protein
MVSSETVAPLISKGFELQKDDFKGAGTLYYLYGAQMKIFTYIGLLHPIESQQEQARKLWMQLPFQLDYYSSGYDHVQAFYRSLSPYSVLLHYVAYLPT